MGYSKPNHTQIPNEFLDHDLAEIKSLAEIKVTLAVMRNTIGFHRSEEVMDVPRLIAATGLSRQSVIDGVKLALKNGRIKRRQSGHGFAYEANIVTVKKVDSSETANSQEFCKEVDSCEPPSLNISLKKERKRSHREPEPEVTLDPPYHSKAFNGALSAYETHTRERGSKITLAQRTELYRVLAQCGSEQLAVDSLKMAVRCGWKGVFPERLNGNGHKKPEQEYTGPVKSVPDPIKENCETCFGTGTIKRRDAHGYEYAEICKHRGNGVAVA